MRAFSSSNDNGEGAPEEKASEAVAPEEPPQAREAPAKKQKGPANKQKGIQLTKRAQSDDAQAPNPRPSRARKVTKAEQLMKAAKLQDQRNQMLQHLQIAKEAESIKGLPLSRIGREMKKELE